MRAGTGIVAVVVVMFAGSCVSSESSISALPAYTPTPADLYKAYSTALDDLDAALDDLDQVRSTAPGKLEAAPEVALNAVQEARNCDVPIDALTNLTLEPHFLPLEASSPIRSLGPPEMLQEVSPMISLPPISQARPTAPPLKRRLMST